MKCERDIFEAVAEPSIRTSIVFLTVGSTSTNALAKHFDSSRQVVSKYLKVLTKCNLIKPQQRGREIFYQLEKDKMKKTDQWINPLRKIWEKNFDQSDGLLLILNSWTNEVGN